MGLRYEKLLKENMMSEIQLKSDLYTATATAVGGRNGHTKNGDGLIDLALGKPKTLGGEGKTGVTTPEDLFAAGYAACFGSACDHVAEKVLNVKPSSIKIETSVTIGADVAGGYGLKVKLKALIGGLDQATATKLIEAAHQVCPYSKAIRGNVHVDLEAALA